MRSKILAAGFILAMMMVLPRNSQAVAVHAFECKTCHIAGVSFTDLTAQVCRQCHDNPTQMHTFSTGQTIQPAVGMLATDASNLFGHGAGGGPQTSHNWAAPTDVVPAAGAQAPSTAITGFYSRYGTSVGKVTCTRCHNPHGDSTDPKLMPVGVASTNELCLDCHVGFNKGVTDHGLHGHPVGMDYAATVGGNPAYKAAPDNGATNGNVTLQADGTVSCTSCHDAHFTDSNASTADGFQSPETNTGDGLLLKHNGPSNENPNAGVTGICQTCHNYMGHGKSGTQIGCMVCHGGHEYDASGNPNYYMLRKTVTLKIDPNTGADISASPLTVNLDYTTLSANYSDGTGTNGAVCLSCHALPGGHDPAATCSDCHKHDGTTSFAPSCGACHGFAPSLNVDGSVTSGGYAHSTTNPTHDYSTSGVLKDESATPHMTHANGGGNYAFACADCHGSGSGNLADLPGAGNHDGGTFQQVLDKGIGTLPVLTTQGNATNPTVLVPTYATSGSGTCTAVYCHSNGEPRGGTTQTVAVSWAGEVKTALSAPGTECQQCHGNDVTTMGTKGDSVGHIKHLGGGGANNLLGKAFSCAVCHAATASSSTALLPAAIGTTHVNGDKDILADLTAAGLTGTITYATDGTCQNTYCHSDGKGNFKTPDWDLANNGVKTRCTLCHNNGTDDGVVANAAPNTGAHQRHVIDADGPKLSCDVCHGTNASSGNIAQHINGTVNTVANLQTTVCDVCHGATASVTTGNDREPVWTDSTTVDCATCHEGVLAVIGGKTAPGKNSFTTTGHGLASGSYGTSNNPAANKGCLDCHTNTADTLHINGTTGDTTRLQAGFTCDSCHGTSGTASSNGINTHHANACTNCHDPHGSSNLYMVKTTSPGNFSGTVAFTALTGTDSFDEADSANGDDLCATCHTTTLHNRADATGVAHHEGENCLTCHLPHTNSPSAFAVGGGDSCDSCHGYPPATGAHLLHAPDSAALDTAGKVYRDATNGYADVTACAYCHPNADKYTYNPSADQVAGYNHSNSTNRPTIMTTIGYDQASATCSLACHSGTSGVTAKWSDTTIGCNACHYEAATPTSAANTADANPLSGTHGKHFDAGAVCTDCHGTLPTDLTHITNTSGATELAKVQGMAKALQDEATIDTVALNATDPDPGNPTCANTACHNPSGGAYSATWNTSLPSCDLCHSSTDPGTGSHTKHMTAATNFGINTIACTSCHVNNGTNYAHRDGVVSFAAGITYSAGANDVGGSVGTCSTSTCHNNGTAAATPVVTPTWGNVPPDACNICHLSTPTSNKHSQHLGDTNYVTSSCATCHTSATATTHINGTRNLTNNITSATLAANGTCTNKCHTVVDGRDWTSGTALNCADCHAAGAGFSLWVASGSGTWPPSSNKHSAHLNSNALPQASPNDCFACHDSTVDSAGALKAGGTHLNLTAGDVAFNANYNYENLTAGRTGTGAATTCSNVRCHDGATTPAWAAASTIACGQCHGNGSGPLPTGTTAGSHSGHANNDATYTDCARCHNGADTYTATGGNANHQNLTVNVGATTAFSTLAYTDANGAAGVNYSGDGVDNGTCANSCHGAGSPNWGTAATVTCTSCHNNGTNDGNILNAVPAASAGVHTTHTGANNAYVPNDCEACHGAGSNTAAYATNINHTDGTVSFGTDLSSYNAGTGTCSNSCHTTGGGNWTSAKTAGLDLNCSDCHGSGKLLDYSTAPPTSGSHANHVATMDSAYGSLARKSDATGYDFGCGQCHGTTAANHLNGSVDFDASVGYSGGTTGTCGTNLCHQDGNGGAPAATPTWGTAFSGDLCAKCHGNSPSSGAHSVHVVGIHAEDLYTGTTGLQTPGNTGADSHGNATYSTTINCNSCHFNTVTSWYDALNPACSSCHNTSNSNLGDNALAITGYDYHVNGVKDIAFQNINIKSRAQLRDDITTVTDLNNTWTRNGSYKTSGSYDQAKASLNTASYTSGTKTCSSVACHNGNTATWQAPQNNCQACHTGLPK